MKIRQFLAILLCIATLSLYSCTKESAPEEDDTENPVNTEEPEEPEVPENPEEPGEPEDPGYDDFDPNTQDITFENAVTIAFSSAGTTITNPFETNGIDVQDTGDHIIINSSYAGNVNYVISGITENGSVKIYGDTAFGLILNGTGIANPAGAAINIQSKEKVTVTLVDLTTNRLIDGAAYETVDGEDMKATFFSEGDLVFGGNGNLFIYGNYKHGLCTDGGLKIPSGSIYVKEAASDGIHANNKIIISGGVVDITSVSDGIECESKTESVDLTGGTVRITTTGEKGHAVKAKQDINVNTNGSITISVSGNASKGLKPSGSMHIVTGNIDITTTGNAIWEEDEQDTSSNACMKVDGDLVIDGGNITMLSSGKGGKNISVDGMLTINGGTISATTTGDQYVYDNNNDTAAKAIKSDGDLTVNGGNITIRTSKNEAEGLESKATLTIKGGTLDIEAYDDCINASNHIQIDGGYIYCKSVTNDAIDSNGTLTITGGTVVAAGASAPEGGIDCDNSTFTVTGGTIIGIGGSTSTPTASVSTQRSLVFRASSSNINIIRIEATAGGEEALTLELPKTYSSSMTLLFSSPLLEAQTGYSIYTGGSISGGSSFHGLYTGATYTQGISAGTFTTGTAGSVSTVGNTGGGPGGGGRP